MTSKLWLMLAIVSKLTTPAMACTDWKAVAAFDALILERDKIALRGEEKMQSDPTCVNFRNGKIELGSPAYRTAEGMCAGADEASQRHSIDVELHRDYDMKDECK